MKEYISAMNKLNTAVKYVASVMFVVLAILVFVQVVTRFVIDFPLAWSEEISRYLMIYIVFLGSALAVRSHQHIAIDFLMEIVSATNKRKLQAVILLLSTVFFAVLCYYGTVLTFTVIGQVTPTLQFSIAWAYAAVPIGSCLMLLNVIAELVELRLEDSTNAGGETN